MKKPISCQNFYHRVLGSRLQTQLYNENDITPNYLPYSRNPLESYSQQSLIGFFVMVFYITVRLVYLTLDIHDKENLIIDDHIFYLLNMVLFCILLPLYYINQVPTLKLYVSVYHHQPPPVCHGKFQNILIQGNL